jgi:hypothetical protein
VLSSLSSILLSILRFPGPSFDVIGFFVRSGFHFPLLPLLPDFQSLEMLSELVDYSNSVFKFVLEYDILAALDSLLDPASPAVIPAIRFMSSFRRYKSLYQ